MPISFKKTKVENEYEIWTVKSNNVNWYRDARSDEKSTFYDEFVCQEMQDNLKK
jgi:hypothetical protein